MENASKALIMAGGVLLTMLIVLLLAYAWNSYSEYQSNLEATAIIENTKKFNIQFTNYDRDDVMGYELLSLVNKVIDYNQRQTEAGESNSDSDKIVGNNIEYKAITIYIDMRKNNTISVADVASVLTRCINMPSKRSSGGSEQHINPIGDNTTLQLFTNSTYTLSDTTKIFGKKNGNLSTVLGQISEIEKNSAFGGEVGIQNLVKNIGSIYEGKIIGYNYGTPDKTWYDEQYIKDRYKTLTGVKMNSIDDIRNSMLVEYVVKYCEYTNFKKSKFKCTGIEYYQDTGRVSKMSFEFDPD